MVADDLSRCYTRYDPDINDETLFEDRVYRIPGQVEWIEETRGEQQEDEAILLAKRAL